MSTTRAMTGGWVDRKHVAKGPNGRGLCRWCNLEAPRGRFTFCSAYCVHEWKLRSQPAYLREQVFSRDKGICARCAIDTTAAARKLRYSRGSRRQEMLRDWGLRTASRRSLWDADHIVPVKEGGGECDVDNIRTLCLRCHRGVTAELRERIRLRKIAMASLGSGRETGTGEVPEVGWAV
jgi:5-methylcytosine-specific restriction protein A